MSARVVTSSANPDLHLLLLSKTIRVELFHRVATKLKQYVGPSTMTHVDLLYWMKLEESFLAVPLSPEAEIRCTTKTIRDFGNLMSENHPWRQGLSAWPDRPCLMDTEGFDIDMHISQRANFALKAYGFWRRCRGNGDEDSSSLGFGDYERKHWVDVRAVERYFLALSHRIANMPDKKARMHANNALEQPKKVRASYHSKRAARADNLRQFIPSRLWTWCAPVDALLPVPKTDDWCAEAVALDTAEPWRAGWLSCPDKHPYNTIYVPCNPHAPLFLPAGFTVETVGPLIVPDHSLDPKYIDPEWDRAFCVEEIEEEEPEEGDQEEGEVVKEITPPTPSSPTPSAAGSSSSVETLELPDEDLDEESSAAVLASLYADPNLA
ncbi:hypothetical protein PHMEG_00021922 [Phytophthora megakarya]|uniref:Uncharacterized protein n=1 Tax=Phytophthora megakarya TaxID=4795 RepID=A0A225VJZ8_9STRA|nr:hypothetical protein PHMEG_00021922 [Phytophthora megakarya]